MSDTEQKVQAKKKMNIVPFIIIGVVILLIVAVVATLVIKGISAESSERKLQENLNLGERYLQELDYEQAIAAYTAAIEIDPKNIDAYLGLADVYVAMGDYDRAVEVLETAPEVSAHEKVKDKIEDISEQKEQAIVTEETSEDEENTEELVQEDAQDATMDSIAHTEDIVGTLTSESGDMTVSVKKLDGYEIFSWKGEDYRNHSVGNGRYNISYRLCDGNAAEAYNEWHAMKDALIEDLRQHGTIYSYWQSSEVVNEDGTTIYCEWAQGDSEDRSSKFLTMYSEVDDNHFMMIEVTFVDEDSPGDISELSPELWIDLTKDCYYTVQYN